MSSIAVQSALHGLSDLAQVLESPLNTLKASLNPPNPSIFSPQPIVAIAPRDVEHAYAVLTSRLQAWGTSIGSKAKEPAPQAMMEAAAVITACLKRDLENLVDLPSALKPSGQLAIPSSSSPPSETAMVAGRQGKSEEELNSKRVLIDVAQSGVKMAGIIFHFRTYYSAFQGVLSWCCVKE